MSRSATTRLKVNPPLGSPPTLEWRAVGELHVDPEYQRSIATTTSQTLIRRIAQFWDWGLCQPLSVARRTDGTLMVVDGQHRLEASKLRKDIPHLPCVITSYANAGDEAAAFVALNQQRRPLTKLDLFKAALTAEDADALAIVNILHRNGLSVAPHVNHTVWKPGMVANIAGIQNWHRIHGEALLDDALGVMGKAFAGQQLRFAGTIFPGVAGFLADNRKAGCAVDLPRLTTILGDKSQVEWRRRIIQTSADTGERRDLAAKRVIAAAYGGALSSLSAPQVEPPKPARPAAPTIAPAPLLAAEMAWCSQCDRRVSGAFVGRCTDRFCKMKSEAAA